MNTYKNNLKFIKKISSDVYRIITKETPLYAVKLEKFTNQDNYIIESQEAKCFLNSIYSVANEMENTFKNVQANISTIIIFGIGNGAVLDYALSNYQNIKKIIIIEPTLDIFKKYLEDIDFMKVINNATKNNIEISLVLNKKEEVVADAIYNEILKENNTAFVYSVAYCSLFNSYYKNLSVILSKLLKVKRGDILTFTSQWRLWLLNSMKNLKIENVVPIENILDLFKGRTVIIISAGPSLNKNIHLIEELKEKAIIIAVGSAIKILDSNGIIPHFRMALDGFPTENKVFEGIDTNSTSLLFSNQLYYEILPNYQGNKIRYIVPSDYLGKYIYKKSNIPYIEIKSGASVANGALNMVCQSGCKKVIFMGQDFSYTEEGLHAKGVASEKDDREWLKEQDYFEVKNIYGEKVYTLDQFLRMKFSMEATIKSYPNIKFINATEGGLKVEGTKNLTAIEVLNNMLDQDTVPYSEMIGNRIVNFKNKEEYINKINKSLRTVKEDLLEVDKIQSEILLSLEKIAKSINKEKEKQKIEALEKKMNNNQFFQEVIKNALQADLLAINNKYKNSDKERLWLNSIYKIREYVELAYKLVDGKYDNIIIKREG